jgi:hypothetical protein
LFDTAPDFMGLTGVSLDRFRARVDEVLADAFPAELLLGVGRLSVIAAGPGGRAVTTYLDGGEAENFRFPFRVKRTDAAGVDFAVGMVIAWKLEDDSEIPLEISELPFRPHEATISFTCKKRRVV